MTNATTDQTAGTRRGLAGEIDPAAPPPVGTLYEFRILAGKLDPRTQAPATSTQQFLVELCGLLDPPGRGPTLQLEIRSDGDTPSRFTLSARHWNDGYAPGVTAVRLPSSVEARPEGAEDGQAVAGFESAGPASGADADRPCLAAGRPRPAQLVMVPIDAIEIAEGRNARQHFDEGRLVQLADSIRANGLVEPVIVVRAGKGFRLIAGERRVRACRQAGEELVEAKVYPELTDRQAARLHLAENFNREELNHIEVARALGQMVEAGLTTAEIAAELHKSGDYVTKHLGLLRLCEAVAELVASGRLPVKQAELIARVGDPDQQIRLAESAMNLMWQPKTREWGAKAFWNARDGEPRDYVAPPKDVRREVEQAMQSLGAAGWIRQREHSGRPFGDRAVVGPCVGCPHNTATAADVPLLLPGVEPRGADKNGYCTHATCYGIKRAAWEEVLADKRAEREKAKRAKIAQARKAGLDVCGECGKVAGDDERFEDADGTGMLCPKCAVKRQRAAERGDGSYSDYERKRKERAERAQRFPETAEQRLAVALAEYRDDLGRQIVGAIRAPGNGASNARVVAYLVAQHIAGQDGELLTRGGWWGDLPPVGEVLDGTCDAGLWLAELACDALQVRPDEEWLRWEYRPEVPEFGCVDVKNVPLPPEAMAEIAELEEICDAWRVERPERPTAESAERDAAEAERARRREELVGTITKGRKAEALAAVAACADAEALRRAAETPKLAKYKAKAIRERIAELERSSPTG